MIVTFIDVGQGDAIWLHLPNGDDVLVDGGKPQAGPTVVAYLLEHGVSDIDVLVATHADSDHIGGLPEVIQAFPVVECWSGSWDCTSDTCTGFYGALADHGVTTTTVEAGDLFPWGDVSCTVLNPTQPLYADRNENSVVMQVSLGTVDVLLTGDAEDGAEGRMRRSGLPIEAEILKVAHHGSNSASTAAFLAAVQPQEAVILVGPNPYDHPRAEVLQRLADVGARVWRTDQAGSIVVTVSQDSWTVITGGQVPTMTPMATHTPTPEVTPKPTWVLWLPLVQV